MPGVVRSVLVPGVPTLTSTVVGKFVAFTWPVESFEIVTRGVLALVAPLPVSTVVGKFVTLVDPLALGVAACGEGPRDENEIATLTVPEPVMVWLVNLVRKRRAPTTLHCR